MENLKQKIVEVLNQKYDGSYRFVKDGMFIKTFGQDAYNEVIGNTKFLENTEYAFSVRVRSYVEDVKENPACRVCGKLTIFNSNNGWQATCSRTCHMKSPDRMEKLKETNLKKYGATNYLASDLGKLKAKETNLRKYGVDNYAKSDEFKNKITTIKNDFYLTEKTLGDFLRQRIHKNFINDSKLQGSDQNYRYDYINYDLKLIVEFDGYGHYTNTKVILNDYEKDKIAASLGFNLIRIPYFIQLKSETIEKLFSEYTSDYRDFNDYPDGFIDKNVTLPAQFCELGQERFLNYLESCEEDLKNDIINSLKEKEKTNDKLLVYFKKLMEYIS